ncbi:MAG: GNAT family N-acetyltransferase [Chloroflexi bacterium CG_4_10_14_0_8_um_filter_46_9]|nr:MAG: GNAT family N-acetyltransferase [Dehalococcoidia bacterium CG2_30_46_19]PIW40229.1 MAG: GNAT family N-acetyltransferase [Chloroflexi bacterium CG15_BIG_FIL_POST_REV_8_21_14_020_46_15]PIZ26934.1 MAG: GNAT family N-acetyltransferase [Chloroflexi bacterium CG_4_10_14_0_8_um_filter_46_9]
MKVDNAKVGDADSIRRMINRFADKGDILPRALSEIYENIRDFFVVRNEGEVVACAALHISWLDLAEIRALAVDEKNQNQRIGSSLVQACLDEAKALGIPTVFCLTSEPAFFEKHGFKLVDKAELPRKVWGECYRCPKFPDCDEVALIYHV